MPEEGLSGPKHCKYSLQKLMNVCKIIPLLLELVVYGNFEAVYKHTWLIVPALSNVEYRLEMIS